MNDEIEPEELDERLRRGERIRLIDVRQPWEHDLARLPGDELWPLDRLAAGVDAPEQHGNEPVVVYCHHGVRSLVGVALLRRLGWTGELRSLAGGIDAWAQRIDPDVPRY